MLTRTIVDIYVTPEIIHIVPCGNPHVHSHGGSLKCWCRVRCVTSIFEGFQGGGQDETLLWVHRLCFPRRYVEVCRVKVKSVVEKVSVGGVLGTRAVVIRLRDLESRRWDLRILMSLGSSVFQTDE